MDETRKPDPRDEIYSKVVKAGIRTYFFDVKYTVDQDLFISITESKKLFDDINGKYAYEKHKLFIQRQDFEKFANGLQDVMDFIESTEGPHSRTPKPERDFNRYDIDHNV